jgi:hypothetical protein
MVYLVSRILLQLISYPHYLIWIIACVDFILDYIWLLYVRVRACISGCKISHFNDIKLYSLIRSKLSYLTGQSGASLCMDARPSIRMTS